MDYKKEIGRRIALSREERGMTLRELSLATGDLLSVNRISNYETGERMPGPSEAVLLAKALQKRPAYIMAVDDIQIPITRQEERLVMNWRTLPERERMDLYRQVEALAMTYRDPVQDQVVAKHLPSAKHKPVNKVTKR